MIEYEFLNLLRENYFHSESNEWWGEVNVSEKMETQS